MEKKPVLKSHKSQRMLWARNHMSYLLKWQSDNLLPFPELLGCPQRGFLKNNALILTANNTKVWFNSQNIKVLEWPACFPDPIENLWGIMCRKVYSKCRKVYSNGRQYSSVNELKNSIKVYGAKLSPKPCKI
ncbi:hypothetical protein AVEN_45086-1 [Araneus ventricosus]|uniref:Transposable element Tc1 transposase n=1 Tax=Araneus ventricosus TaxID=182803 RepID=A0A4Y2FP32_ARAVE|nr:hypothetical protein AVEN_45086-1 [Araneus ventricosus]